jgi:hypothetical protein
MSDENCQAYYSVSIKKHNKIKAICAKVRKVYHGLIRLPELLEAIDTVMLDIYDLDTRLNRVEKSVRETKKSKKGKK